MKLGAYQGAMVEENGRDLVFQKPPKYKDIDPSSL
jgi:hypothetical protein